MAWFRLGGAGISAALKNAMTAVLNKKLGTSQEYAPNAWPEEVNLLGALEEKTASGSIVTFADGADDVPLKSCEVALPASLDGYSSVDVVHCGKNLLINNGIDISGSGLSFTVNSDKSVTISGVATADAFFTFFENVLFKASSYMIRGSGNSNVQIIVRIGTASGSNIRTASSSDISWNLAEDTLCACVIRVASGTDLTTPITVYPQIEVGSSLSNYETAISTTYTASLGRTIHGGEVDIVNGVGTDDGAVITLDENGSYGISTGSPTNRISVNFYNNVGKTNGTFATNDLTVGENTAGGYKSEPWVIWGSTSAPRMWISVPTTIDTVDKFKEYLANNPITVAYQLSTPTDFTFTGQEVPTRLGYNAFWSDGDMSVTYRASGTVTPIQPTLISKTITANGTYTAEDDGADGYDEVVVNVASQEPIVTPLNSPNAFLTLSGVSGTDVERTVRTETASVNGKYVFASDSTCRTNTGSGDGFIEIRKNDVSVVKQYMSVNTTTDITIPNISVEAGDEVNFVVGFDNAHSSCNFQLYTGIAFVSEASVSLLSMSNSNSSNELENELNNLDESEAEQNEELI